MPSVALSMLSVLGGAKLGWLKILKHFRPELTTTRGFRHAGPLHHGEIHVPQAGADESIAAQIAATVGAKSAGESGAPARVAGVTVGGVRREFKGTKPRQAVPVLFQNPLI